MCRLIIRTHLCQAAKRNSAFVQDVYFYQYNLLTESHSPLACRWQLHFSSWVGKRKLSEPAYSFDGFVQPRTILQCRENDRPRFCVPPCIILYRYLMSLSEFSMSFCDSLMLRSTNSSTSSACEGLARDCTWVKFDLKIIRANHRAQCTP